MVSAFLNKLISKKDFGRFDPKKGKPIHCNTTAEIVKLHTGKLVDRWGQRRHYVSSITREKFAAHWANEATFYFTAGDSERFLVMVDVDCHKAGTAAGATACAEWIKDNLFAGMYHEPSTNGNGRHGYLIVERDGRTNDEVVDWLGKLQDYIRGFEHLHHVELVELKGHPFSAKRNSEGWAVDLEFGQLAKVPRDIVNRFEEFKNTTVLSVASFAFHQVPGVEAKKPQAKVGSWGSKLVQPASTFEAVARLVMGGAERIKVEGRADLVYTVEDMAAGIAVVHAATKFPKPAPGSRWADVWIPGTMPTMRLKALWVSAFKAGDVTRPWNDNRWAAVRNRMSEYGLIEWEDNSHARRRSMKWAFKEDVMAELDALVTVTFDNGSLSTPEHPQAQPEAPILSPLGLPYGPSGGVSGVTFDNGSLSPEGNPLDRLAGILSASWSEEYVVPEEVRSLLTAQAVEDMFEARWPDMMNAAA